MLLRRPSLFTLVILSGTLAGCDGSSKNAPAPVTRAEADAPPSEATEADSAEPDAAASPARRAVHPPLTLLNVPECDKFVEKYVACVELHVPADQRARIMDELHLHRARWRELEKMQEGKVAAGLSCRGVAQRLKGDLIVDYGCEF